MKRRVHNQKIMTDTQKEIVLSVVAKLDRRGYTQMEIVEGLKKETGIGVSQSSICLYLKEIRKAYAEAKIEQREALVNEKVQQLREVRREAWEAWERSKSSTRKVTREKGIRLAKEKDKEPVQFKLPRGKKAADRGDVEESLRLLKVITVNEGRLPANAFLEVILKTIEAEAKLRGLFQEIHINNTTNLVNEKVEFPWEEFFTKVCQVTDAKVVETTAVAIPEGESNGSGE